MAAATATATALICSLVNTPRFFEQCGRCSATARTPRDATLNLFDPATGECACSLCAGHRSMLQIRRSSYHGE
jgi:hypothetical protein